MSSIKNPEYLQDAQEGADEEKNKVVGGTLYLVATPIGNLGDLSARALKVLSEVDFIAAEDTRNSAKLLTLFDIRKPLISYFEHNKRQRGEEVARRLLAGESCALITDAGMPAISDPGEDLVRLCAEQNIPVTCVPGCCASVTALTLSGLPTGRFTFEGFLSMNKGERRERLAELKTERRTMLFHEAPHKLKATLADFAETFGGERRIALCRELTKRNEEITRTTISEAVTFYEEHEPRGEYVLVVEGASDQAVAESEPWAGLSIEEHFAKYLADHPGVRGNDAVKAVAKERGVAKSEVYDLVMKKTDGSGD